MNGKKNLNSVPVCNTKNIVQQHEAKLRVEVRTNLLTVQKVGLKATQEREQWWKQREHEPPSQVVLAAI